MLESQVGVWKIQKASDLQCSHPPETSPHCSGGTTRATIWTLYSCWFYLMWQTCWRSWLQHIWLRNTKDCLKKKKVYFQFGFFQCSVIGCRMQFCFSGVFLSPSCAIGLRLYFPISTVCKLSATRVRGNVPPPATSSLYPVPYAYSPHTHKPSM